MNSFARGECVNAEGAKPKRRVSLLAILGWIFVPYIMLPVVWKRASRAGKVFGTIYVAFTVIGTVVNVLNLNRPTVPTASHQALRNPPRESLAALASRGGSGPIDSSIGVRQAGLWRKDQKQAYVLALASEKSPDVPIRLPSWTALATLGVGPGVPVAQTAVQRGYTVDYNGLPRGASVPGPSGVPGTEDGLASLVLTVTGSNSPLPTCGSKPVSVPLAAGVSAEYTHSPAGLNHYWGCLNWRQGRAFYSLMGPGSESRMAVLGRSATRDPGYFGYHNWTSAVGDLVALNLRHQGAQAAGSSAPETSQSSGNSSGTLVSGVAAGGSASPATIRREHSLFDALTQAYDVLVNNASDVSPPNNQLWPTFQGNWDHADYFPDDRQARALANTPPAGSSIYALDTLLGYLQQALISEWMGEPVVGPSVSSLEQQFQAQSVVVQANLNGASHPSAASQTTVSGVGSSGIAFGDTLAQLRAAYPSATSESSQQGPDGLALYNYQVALPPQAQIVILGGRVEMINVSKVTWDSRAVRGFVQKILPPDARLVTRKTLDGGALSYEVYTSASLKPLFSSDVWTWAGGRTGSVTVQTFMKGGSAFMVQAGIGQVAPF